MFVFICMHLRLHLREMTTVFTSVTPTLSPHNCLLYTLILLSSLIIIDVSYYVCEVESMRKWMLVWREASRKYQIPRSGAI